MSFGRFTTGNTEQDARFNAWMEKVDRAILRRTGLLAGDLPDYCYRDAFEDGRSPVAVANAAIRAAGGC